ncbi:MAG TPA: glycosyltransferase family 4 protein [Verrucomicrobiae bacterium]|nr:glycosyltransferase family 4 protein [Verrucomicrobiae bacterium]
MRAVHMPFDQVNPYQTALGDALRELGVAVDFRPLSWRVRAGARGAEVLHIHWTYPLLGGSIGKFLLGYPFLAAQLVLLRARGCRIVWTVHNLENHEKKRRLRQRLLSYLIGHVANKVIVHGQTARDAVKRHFRIPKRKIVVIPHGNFIGLYPDAIGRNPARRALNLPDSARVVLFLGNIRPYKGVNELIRVFKSAKAPDAILLIAGRLLAGETEQRIRSEIADDPRIRLHPGLVAPHRIQILMNAADVVVLPYRDVLTSGAVVLAMSYGKPCVAPAIGCIADVLDDRVGFLYGREDEQGLTRALNKALAANGILEEMGRHNRARAEQWSWPRIAAATLQVYQNRAS